MLSTLVLTYNISPAWQFLFYMIVNNTEAALVNGLWEDLFLFLKEQKEKIIQ